MNNLTMISLKAGIKKQEVSFRFLYLLACLYTWQEKKRLELKVYIFLYYNPISAIGNIEGQWAMMGKPLTNFSVEQIVDCDGMEDVAK